MTGPFTGLAPAGVTLAGPDNTLQPANDNAPGAKGQRGFRGLLLRRKGDDYEIVLLHAEAGLSQRVETAADDADIIALWRSIGRKLNLPLLAETDVGDIVQIDPSPWLTAAPRRGGSALSHRRPRFLARRQVGAAEARTLAQSTR